MTSDIRRLVIDTYQEYVRDHERIPTELKRALKTHERVPIFVDRLTAQIKRLPAKYSRETIVSLARDLSEYFILNVERMSEERLMSPIKKAMLKAKQDRDAQFRKDVEELEKRGQDLVTETPKGTTEKTTFLLD